MNLHRAIYTERLRSEHPLVVKATIDDTFGGNGISVIATWSTTEGAIDRPSTHSFAVKNGKMARRLIAAINAGAVYLDPELKRDGNGQTYVASKVTVFGRTLSADLTKLGY